MKTSRRSAAPRRAVAAQASIGKGAAVCALALSSGILFWAAQARAQETLDSIFARFDSNGDGVIDRTEYDLNKVLVIVAIDRNGDGNLEPGEVKISAENFAALDQNGDGKISGFEFVESPLGKFETIDANSDGQVTKEELQAYILKLRN